MPWDVIFLLLTLWLPLSDDHHYIDDSLDREYEEERQRDTRPIPPTAHHKHYE